METSPTNDLSKSAAHTPGVQSGLCVLWQKSSLASATQSSPGMSWLHTQVRFRYYFSPRNIVVLFVHSPMATPALGVEFWVFLAFWRQSKLTILVVFSFHRHFHSVHFLVRSFNSGKLLAWVATLVLRGHTFFVHKGAPFWLCFSISPRIWSQEWRTLYPNLPSRFSIGNSLLLSPLTFQTIPPKILHSPGLDLNLHKFPSFSPLGHLWWNCHLLVKLAAHVSVFPSSTELVAI